jgi:hypothetical protein
MAGGPVAFVSDAVALLGDAVTVISGPLALVNGALAFVGGVVALVGGVVALVGDAVAFVGADLGLVKGSAALGQVGLVGPQGLFGGLGAGLGLPDPGIVQGQGGQPLALSVLNDLPGQLGQRA